LKKRPAQKDFLNCILKIHSSKNIITARKKMAQGRSKFYKHWSLRRGVDAPRREFTAQIKKMWMDSYELNVFRRTTHDRYEYAYSQIMPTQDQAITQANLVEWGLGNCEQILKDWDYQKYQEEQDFGVATSWKDEFESRYTVK
jgi:hypothetical protein